MKRKILISCGVVFGILAVIVVLLFTLFALHGVKVNLRTSVSQDFPTEEQIVEAGQFSYGLPVMFLSKAKFKENIEKTYPYVEVVNIETSFPGSFTVHVRQRQKVFAFKNDGKTYYCDNNLVVLDESEDNFVSTQDNCIYLSGLQFPQQQIRPGDKLEVEGYVDFFDALVSCNRSLTDQQTIIKSMEYFSQEDANNNTTSPAIKITAFSGQVFYVYNVDKYTSYKAQRFLAAYSYIYSLVGQTITTDIESPYCNQLWTEELLDRAYVVVNNYYDVSDKENPAYANIYPPEPEI